MAGCGQRWCGGLSGSLSGLRCLARCGGSVCSLLACVLCWGLGSAWAGPPPDLGPPPDSVRVQAAGLPTGLPLVPLVPWILGTRDHADRPFVVIDKRAARAWAFAADGALRGSAPVLMGAARGDHSVPGIGERPLSLIRPQERTTPAGRFEAEMGHNAQGEDILWVDYEAAISLHRVRAHNPAEQRLQRLASPTPHDNRISYGCINVPQDFFEAVVLPLLRASAGQAVVYVLPEVLPLGSVFPGAAAWSAALAASASRGGGRLRAGSAAR